MNNFLIHTIFPSMISIRLFYYCGKVFNLINIWMIRKRLMKIYYLKKKIYFYSQLNMEDITETDYMHARKVCKDFKIKNIGEYYDLYVQSDTLLLAHVFGKFRNMCLVIHEFDLARFLTALRLA